jgi:glycosyltransferase involved in cell wall biosynthesis
VGSFIKILPISVVIPTYKRTIQLEKTIKKIYTCDPLPAEIIIHIDAGDSETEIFISRLFPEILLVSSHTTQGPGGGRNIAIDKANHEIVATFDDDSYPIQKDYFFRLVSLFAKDPLIAVIESTIYHRFEKKPTEVYEHKICNIFTGCGVAYRKSMYQIIGGYIPINPAYGIEEADFSIRSKVFPYLFIRSSWLTVYHDTLLDHHDSVINNSAALSNLGLLVYLRYPLKMWPYGILQILNRFIWSLQNKRFRGLIKGIFEIPIKCVKFRKYRKTLHISVIVQYLHKREKLEAYEFEM